MSGKHMTAKWTFVILFGITAAVILLPLKPGQPGLGVGMAQAALSGTYTMEGQGVIVSSTDTPTTCVAGPCTATSIKAPEKDFIDVVGILTFTGTSVTGNTESVELSDTESPSSASPANDNQFHSGFGIPLSGSITYGTGSPIPTSCFTIKTTGNVVLSPASTICFKTASEGCQAETSMEFHSNSTLTAIGVAASPAACSTAVFHASPLILLQHGHHQ